MSRLRILAYVSLGLLALSAAPQSRLDGQCCYPCADPCLPMAGPVCAPPVVQCTVLVPQWVTENRPQTVTRYRRETRERTIVVYRDVPFTKTIEEAYTVMVPQPRTRTVEETINHPVYRDIELRKTTMVPQIEAREASHTVCRMVPVQEERTISEVFDRVANTGPAVIRMAGYQRESPAAEAVPPPPRAAGDPNAPPPPPTTPPAAAPAVAAAGSACCQPACDVCAPVVVQRKACVTCMKPVSERETIQYPVAHLQPTARLQTVSFYEFQPETVSHDEQYFIDVPEKRVRTRQVTETRSIPVEQRVPYSILVPYHAEIQVPVSVLRCVEQQITVPAAPACDPCGD